MDCIWLRTSPAVGSCKHTNKNSGSIKGNEFMDQLSDY